LHSDQRRHRRLLAIAIAAGTVTAACGGGESDDSAPASAAPGTEAPAPTTVDPDLSAPSSDPSTTTVSGSGVIGSFDAARPGVIQLVAQGSRRELEGYELVGGTGTGFFISPDGVAVTNQHVVTGAATLEVFVGGDTSTAYDAQVLGASECNDLAVVQVAGISDAPYFEWYDDSIEPGIDVYAAGFPLSDPEYTLTRGIVTKASADRSSLPLGSSVDRAIEHDANIQQGNSGGPLITADGRVLGVNYQLRVPSASMQPQFYAIHGELAQEITEILKTGDHESLGLNSIPVADEELGFTGIWVRAVEPGSPAARAGILPGDVVLNLNSLPMALDGTYKDYCQVLRTSGDRPIAVEVLRVDTGEILRGELRGDTELEVVRALAEAVEETTDVDAVGTPYTTFDSLVDDTGRIGVSVPTEWAQRSTSPTDFGDGVSRPLILATPDLAAFQSGFSSPGLALTLLEGATDIEAAIALLDPGAQCTRAGTFDYEDTKFTGRYSLYAECGPEQASALVLAATADGIDGIVLFGVQMVSQADLAILDRLLQSFDAV
jgi:serine protease Do